MGHPDNALLGDAREEVVFLFNSKFNPSEFRDGGRGALSPKIGGHELMTRADSQDGDGGILQITGAVAQMVVVADPWRPAGENQGGSIPELVWGGGIGGDFGGDPEIPECSPFPMGPLTAIIDNINFHSFLPIFFCVSIFFYGGEVIRECLYEVMSSLFPPFFCHG